MGQYKSAVNLLNEVAPSYPKDSELYYFLGEANRGIGFEKNAIKAYQHALNISANDLRTIKSLGWVYVRMGEYDKAENLIKKYMKKTR